MSPWHDVEFGANAPEVIECIIEIPKGSHNKYEVDKKSGLLRVDRVLFSAVHYPANYGFIPQTYWYDDDPMDVLVLGQEAVAPLCIVTARVIGVMQMVDDKGEDDKIIAVHENDPAVNHYRDISQLPEHALHELQRFFEEYKVLEKKAVHFENFMGRIDAQNLVTESIKLYKQYFKRGGVRKRTSVPKRRK
jgi:inorganic pyrophosphatase